MDKNSWSYVAAALLIIAVLVALVVGGNLIQDHADLKVFESCMNLGGTVEQCQEMAQS